MRSPRVEALNEVTEDYGLIHFTLPTKYTTRYADGRSESIWGLSKLSPPPRRLCGRMPGQPFETKGQINAIIAVTRVTDA